MNKKTTKKVMLKDKDVSARKGKHVKGGIQITKVVDSSSPNLMLNCCTGTHLAK